MIVRQKSMLAGTIVSLGQQNASGSCMPHKVCIDWLIGSESEHCCGKSGVSGTMSFTVWLLLLWDQLAGILVHTTIS